MEPFFGSGCGLTIARQIEVKDPQSRKAMNTLSPDHLARSRALVIVTSALIVSYSHVSAGNVLQVPQRSARDGTEGQGPLDIYRNRVD